MKEEKKKIRVIMINSGIKELIELNIEPTLEEYYKLIGCDMVEYVRISMSHHLIIDEEGLLKQDPVTVAFTWDGRLMAGNALIVGHDEQGETTDCRIPILDAAMHVQFPPRGWRLDAETHQDMITPKITFFKTTEEYIQHLEERRKSNQ